jgi:hypothetical protein
MANPFAALAEEQPTTSPRKKARATKRRATSPPPSNKEPKAHTATECLYLARDIISTAIQAEKLALEESYIEDNDIQLLYNELQNILNKRPMIFRQQSSNIELDTQIAKISVKLDTLIKGTTSASAAQATSATQANISATQAQKPAMQTPIDATQPIGTTQPKEGIEAKKASNKPLSFAEVLKRPQTQQAAPKVITYRERRLILQGTAQKYPIVDSKGLRDQINKAFNEKCQIVTPVIGTVTKSLKGGDIILSTTEKFDAEFLKRMRLSRSPY